MKTADLPRRISRPFPFRLACLGGLVGACIAATGGAASAATFTVNTLADSGGGSLRDAITQANATAGADAIVFSSGLTGTIALASDLPAISDSLTIAGPGPRVLSISGGNARRVLRVTAPATLTAIRLANGFADRGSGIQFDNAGTLTVSDCHFDQGLATANGGAISLEQGSLVAERCTFTTNQAAGEGGCIFFGQGAAPGDVTITNCTFVNSFATNRGGAIRQAATTAYDAAITNCTFVVNNAGNNGGAISISGGTLTLLNNLFAANGAGGNAGAHVGQLGGVINSLGHNLFGDLGGTTFTPAASDRFGMVGAQLNTGVLVAFPFNNGGLTDTLPLNATSIAIDAGGVSGAPPADQRNFPRVGCLPDIGAFEVQTVTDTDADGVLNCLDACPNTPACALVDQTGCPTDSDGDGVAAGCDTCPATVAGDPVDANGCSTADEDGDGVLNDADRCRGTPACATPGVDGAGCPADADSDGIFDGCDRCAGANDLTDADSDGIPGCLDACPDVGDSDGDGVQDCQDGCPSDPLKRDPGACGCGQVESDADSDGILSCVDACPNTPGCATVDQTGCPSDSDADGAFDGCDSCPDTTIGEAVDGAGCSVLDEDADGVLNDADACRGTPACARGAVDARGCTADSDGDGVLDGCDLCPNENDLADEDGDGIPDCLVEPDTSTNRPPLCGPGVGASAMLMLVLSLAGRSPLRHRGRCKAR